MSTPDRKISTSEIAQLAGVSTAAVSQWRKRHPDTFPEALPGKGRAILFNRTDVLNWLKDNGRTIRQGRGAADALRGLIEASKYGPVLLFFAAYASVDSPHDLPSPLRGEVEELFAKPGIPEAYTALTDRYTPQDMLAAADDAFAAGAREGGEYSTPTILNELIADLVPTAPQTVLDFTCGTGGTLQAVHHRFPEATLQGNDINPTALATAQARAIADHWTATWTKNNVIEAEALSADSFDLVCSSPPFSVKVDRERLEEQPERWPYGVPGMVDDAKWLQLAHRALTDSGIAIIHVMNSVLFSRRAGSTMPAMVADGSLLAVISLPGNLMSGTSIPSALVVFTKNPKNISDTVLFATVAAEEGHTPARKVTALDTDALLEAYTAHMAGQTIPNSTTAVQIPRLELIGTEKTLMPTFWVAKAQPPQADELRDTITTVINAIEPLDAVGQELDDITLSAEKTTRSIPVTKLPGIKHIPRPSDEDLLAGDICIGASSVDVCTVDQKRPSTGLVQVIRCDPEVVDPWFLASIIDAVRRSGALSTGVGIPQVDLRLIDVPNINIAEQRKLGEAIKTLRARQRQVQEQAQRWEELTKAVADAIAAGIATPS